MPYSIKWYIENEVIYIHYSGTMTSDELRASLITTKGLIEESPRFMVHLISDAGDITDPVSPKEALGIVRDIGSHPRAGWNILLREKSLVIRMGVALGTSFLRSRTRAFNSLDQAEAFLKDVDTALSWDKVNQIDTAN